MQNNNHVHCNDDKSDLSDHSMPIKQSDIKFSEI